jgi:hypothetical protein
VTFSKNITFGLPARYGFSVTGGAAASSMLSPLRRLLAARDPGLPELNAVLRLSECRSIFATMSYIQVMSGLLAQLCCHVVSMFAVGFCDYGFGFE